MAEPDVHNCTALGVKPEERHTHIPRYYLVSLLPDLNDLTLDSRTGWGHASVFGPWGSWVG